MMLDPGALAVLRYVSSIPCDPFSLRNRQQPKKDTRPSLVSGANFKSYKNNNIDEPALHVGMAIPPLGESVYPKEL